MGSVVKSKDESKYEIANILEVLSPVDLRMFSGKVLRELKKGSN